MLIYSYNPASKGAKALSRELGAKRIKHHSLTFKGRASKSVINWGASAFSTPAVLRCRVYNPPEAVAVAADKLKFFRAMEGSGLTPSFCTASAEALRAIVEDGGTMVCRTVLRGHSGAGIVIASSPEELVQAPLYVKYIPKREEYRVHVIKGQVVDTQRKARRSDIPDGQVNWQVRNHHNGFVYAREGLVHNPRIEAVAIQTVERLGLDFGAVDIIWNEKHDRYWVLEVNTAPGLEGQTVRKYAEAFRRL